MFKTFYYFFKNKNFVFLSLNYSEYCLNLAFIRFCFRRAEVVNRRGFIFLQYRVSSNKRGVSSYKRRVSSYERRVSSYKRRVSSYIRRVSSYKRRVSSNKKRVSSNKSRVSSNKSRVSSYKSRVSSNKTEQQQGSILCKEHFVALQCPIFNPFKPNGISYSYPLDQSISVLRVVGWYF